MSMYKTFATATSVSIIIINKVKQSREVQVLSKWRNLKAIKCTYIMDMFSANEPWISRQPYVKYVQTQSLDIIL